MVCTVCGAELADGARFCPSCGTPVGERIEEAAEAVIDRGLEEAGSLGGAPAEEVPVSAPSGTNAFYAAPDIGGFSDTPAADSAPVYTPPVDSIPVYTPPADTGPVYTPPADNGPYYAPPAGGSPVPPPPPTGPAYPPAGDPKPVKPKKKWLIPAIAAAAVVIVALVLIFLIPQLGGPSGKPDDYYHKVELKGLKDVTDTAATYYGNVLSAGDKVDDVGFSGSAELSLGDDFSKLLGDADIDLDWIKTVSLDYEINKKEDLTGGALTLKLNKDKLATLNLLMDMGEQMFYLQAPEISKNFIGVETEDLSYSLLRPLRYSAPGLYYSLDSLLSDPDSESAEQITRVMEAMPTQDQLKKLLDKYLEIAINSIEGVERDKGTLDAGDVSAEYTTLTVTINKKLALDIAENVLTAMKEDKDIEKYIGNIAEALDEDADDIYEEFQDSLDDALDELDDSREDDSGKKDKIIMTLYVDRKGNIVGREVKTSFEYGPKIQFRYATPTKGGKLGVDISLKQDGQTLFSIAGTGKISGSSISLEASLKVSDYGEAYKVMDITVEKLDGAKLKKGQLKGVITLKPSADLISQMYLSDSETRMVKKMSLTLDLDTGKNSANVKVILNYDDSPMVTLNLSGKSGSAKKVDTVKDYLEADEWAEELDADDLEKFLKDLKKTDIPSEYLEELEDYIDYIS